MDWRSFFRGKKVTLMGLGLQGRGVGDAEFLARVGAELLVTDLKSAAELEPSCTRLQRFKDITYHLGGHLFEDFRKADLILKAAGVPLASPYVTEGRAHRVPIEMDASLFIRLAPPITVIGVTGTRGKSTTAALIGGILKAAGRRVFMGGNIKDTATLLLLEKVQAGDYVVLELDSWQLQGFGEAQISPHIALFTTFLPDHMDYYRGNMSTYFADKANIFKYQQRATSGQRLANSALIVGEQALPFVARTYPGHAARATVVRASDVPVDWRPKVIGGHNRLNIACAAAAARALAIPESFIQQAVESFPGLAGRLELLGEVRGVKIYNDNSSTTPDATLAALLALRAKSETRKPGQIQNPRLQTGKNIILIMGGSDKGLDMGKLVEEIPKHCRAVVLLRGTGTDKLIFNYQFSIFKKETLKECVEQAMKIAQKGDILLFSPAFASFGKWFRNEYDREEQFVKLMSRIKH